MAQNLISEIEAFKTETGLSDHRIGMLLASNGKLIERLRSGRRIWPDTEERIRENLTRERQKRLPAFHMGAASEDTTGDAA